MAAANDIDTGFRQVLDAIKDAIYVTAPDRTIVCWSVLTGERNALGRADAAMYAGERLGRDGFSVNGNGSGP